MLHVPVFVLEARGGVCRLPSVYQDRPPPRPVCFSGSKLHIHLKQFHLTPEGVGGPIGTLEGCARRGDQKAVAAAAEMSCLKTH